MSSPRRNRTSDHRRLILIAPALSISAALLAGCASTDEPAPEGNTSGSPSGSMSVTPTHGGMRGGNLVLVNVGSHTDQAITATFGDADEVTCEFDEASGQHACTVPAASIPETVDLTFAADGNAIGEAARYTYTTDGMQDSPVLTVNTEMVHQHAENVRSYIPEGVQLGAVLKNGEPVDVFGTTIDDAAAPEYFFVPSVHEAIELRNAGITSQIAVMYVAQIEDIPLMLHYDIEAAVADPAWIEQAEQEMSGSDAAALKVHLWIDTGMGREGALPEDALSVAQRIANSNHVELAGIATHFSTITSDDAAALTNNDTSNITVMQKNRFDEAVASIRDTGLGENALIHAGASDALIYDLEPLYYDLLRIGGMFFGSTSPAERVYSWSTQLQQVKTLPEGWCVDYGCTTPSEQPLRVGVINHIPSRATELTFTVNGVSVPAILNHGTVVTLDLTEVPDATVGTEVTIDFDPEQAYMLDASLPLPVTINQ